MQMGKHTFIFLALLLLQWIACAAKNASDSVVEINFNSHGHHQKNAINIYVISRDKYFDITNRFIVLQAKIASFFHNKRLKVILATSTADAEKKIAALVTKKHFAIDNLWFDSHGKYRKGYSSFMIGSDEYYYKSITDSFHFSALKKIAAYCDEYTNVAIGSCYAAADYDFPVSRNDTHHNMRGDSLIKTMSRIFNGSNVYACESWVMAKPGIFGRKNALAGFPIDKEYKDTIFKSVWNRMGMWRLYNANNTNFENINTVYLSGAGDILIQNKTYMSQKKAQRKLKRNLKKLRPDLYSLTT